MTKRERLTAPVLRGLMRIANLGWNDIACSGEHDYTPTEIEEAERAHTYVHQLVNKREKKRGK